MLLQHSRRLMIGMIALATVVAAPSRSKADIFIQVEEGTITTTGGTPSFTPTGPVLNYDLGPSKNGTTFITNGSAGAIISTNFTIGGTVTLASDPSSNAVSLSTGLTLGITSSFPLGGTQGLEVIISSTDLANSSPAGTPGSFTNSAGGSNGGNSGGSISVWGTSTIAGVTSDSSTNINELTTGSVSSLPNPFSITQTLLINATAQNGASTFSSGISTSVNTNAAAVPAPAGLVLGLIGLPLIGLRRMVKSQAAAN